MLAIEGERIAGRLEGRSAPRVPDGVQPAQSLEVDRAVIRAEDRSSPLPQRRLALGRRWTDQSTSLGSHQILANPTAGSLWIYTLQGKPVSELSPPGTPWNLIGVLS